MVRITLFAALSHVADDETERLKFELVEPKIIILEALVEKRLAQLLEPHTKGHPITYNHYLTENVQKAQQARHPGLGRGASSHSRLKWSSHQRMIDRNSPRQWTL